MGPRKKYIKKTPCIVPWCTNYTRMDTKTSFHRFPKDAERRASWVSILDLDSEIINNATLVCSSHFRINQYKNANNMFLKKDALPFLRREVPQENLIKSKVLEADRNRIEGVGKNKTNDQNHILKLEPNEIDTNVPVASTSTPTISPTCIRTPEPVISQSQAVFFSLPQSQFINNPLESSFLGGNMNRDNLCIGNQSSDLQIEFGGDTNGDNTIHLFQVFPDNSINSNDFQFQPEPQMIEIEYPLTPVPLSSPEHIPEVSILIPEVPILLPEVPILIPEIPIVIPEVPILIPEVPILVPEVPILTPKEPILIPEVSILIPEVSILIPNNTNSVVTSFEFCVVCDLTLPAESARNCYLTQGRKEKIRQIFYNIFNFGSDHPFTVEGDFPFCFICVQRLTDLNAVHENILAYKLEYKSLKDSIVKQVLKNFCTKRIGSNDVLDQLSGLELEEIEEKMYQKFKDHLCRKIVTADKATSVKTEDCPATNITNNVLNWKTASSVNFATLGSHNAEEMEERFLITAENSVFHTFQTVDGLNSAAHLFEGNDFLDNSAVLDDLVEDNLSSAISPSETRLLYAGVGRNNSTCITLPLSTTSQLTYLQPQRNDGKRIRKKSNISCPVCKKQVPKSVIKFHMACHAGDKKFECNICGKVFTWPSNLNGHLETHLFPYANKWYYCQWCCTVFKSKYTFLHHVLEVHLNTEIVAGDEMTFYHCDSTDCMKCFHSWDAYYSHVNDHSGVPYLCLECQKIFAHKDNFQAHLEQVHNSETTAYSCLYCIEVFSDVSSLNLHQKTHSVIVSHQLFPFLCDICGGSYTSKYRLMMHRTRHKVRGIKILRRKTKERNMIIQKRKSLKPKCIENEQLAKTLELTLAKSTAGSRLDYVCPVCGQTFRRFKVSIFNTHLDTHVYPNGFQCYICNVHFAKRHKLEVHLRQHKGLPKKSKAFICKFCPLGLNTFNQRLRHYVNAHRQEYLAEKPFLCEICNKNFSSEEALSEHVQNTHEKSKCKECGKQYRSAGKLQEHLNSHTGEKYKCQFCDKLYTNKSNLKVHLWRHRDNRPYTCKICPNVGYIRRKQLEVHAKKFHGNVIEQQK